MSATQSGTWTVTVSNFPSTVDVLDRAARLLGHVTVDNFPTDYFKAGQNIGNTGFNVNNWPSTYDVLDRAARLLGIVYGSQSQQLQQRATTYDLLVQLRTAGTEYDARQIRALTSSDVVSAVQSGAWSVSVSNFPSSPYDISDRAARLLGVIYGSQGQQLKQTDTNYNLQVELATGATLYDARQIRALTSADVVSVNNFANPLPVSESGAWSVSVSNFPSSPYDVSDRAARLLGVVYGSQGQQLQQRASTYDLIVQLRSAGVEIDPRSIRALAKATDEIYSVLRTDAGVAYDATQIRALTTSDLITAYGSQTQALLQSASTYDLLVQLRTAGTEYDARQIRALTSSDVVSAVQSGAWSVSVSNFPSTYDVSDRAARLVGVVYGSQAQQLLQRTSTYDLLVQLRTAGTEYDARQIRALTSADVVTAQQLTRTSMTVKPEREDKVSVGGTYSPNGSVAVQIVAASGTTTIKVYNAGYHCAVDGLHYFYFGTSTTAPTLPANKVFLMCSKAGHYRQIYPEPEVSAAGNALYYMSAVAESAMPIDVGYVQE